jgi:hypothetical protein
MKVDDLEKFIDWSDITYIEVLAKAVLLDKVSITSNGQIKVKAFNEDE